MEYPLDFSTKIKLVFGAILPPGFPELLQPLPGVIRCFLVNIWMEKSCDTKDKRRDSLSVRLQLIDRKTLCK